MGWVPLAYPPFAAQLKLTDTKAVKKSLKNIQTLKKCLLLHLSSNDQDLQVVGYTKDR